MKEEENAVIEQYVRRSRSWGWYTSYKNKSHDPHCAAEVDATLGENQDHNVNEKSQDHDEQVVDVVKYHLDEFIYYMLYKLRFIDVQRGPKEARQAYRKFLRTSLFWSITAAIGGILGYYSLFNKPIPRA